MVDHTIHVTILVNFGYHIQTKLVKHFCHCIPGGVRFFCQDQHIDLAQMRDRFKIEIFGNPFVGICIDGKAEF